MHAAPKSSMSARERTRSDVLSCSQSSVRWYASCSFCADGSDRAVNQHSMLGSCLRMQYKRLSSTLVHMDDPTVSSVCSPAIQLTHVAMHGEHRGACSDALDGK